MMRFVGPLLTTNKRQIYPSSQTVYPDPYAFKPERFLREDGTPNPEVPSPEPAFGYGRR